MRKGPSYVLRALTVIAYVLLALVALVLLSLVGLLIVELVPYIQEILTSKLPATSDVATAIATLVTGIVTAVGVAVAIFAGLYARKQLLTGQKIAYGDFLLRLDEAFRQYKAVHTKLRPGGEWSLVGPDGKLREKVDGPKFPEDGPAVEGYMGLFERVQVLLEKGLIDDIDVVERLYGYRLFNIVENPNIYQKKLVKLARGWRDFIKLWLALQEQRDKTRRTEEAQYRQVSEAMYAALQNEKTTMDRQQDGRQDDRNVNALIALLTHSNSNARAFAVRQLALVRDQDLRARARKALITARQDKNSEVRLWAKRTLQFYEQPLPDDP